MAYLFLFLLLHLRGAAQNKVIADVRNFENSKGLCRACIFNSSSAFRESRPVACVNVPVADRMAQVTFNDIPDGTYALFVFHDANGNGAMDKNWIGIPKEGYGASKNKLPFASAPTFEANRFSLSQNASLRLVIRLRNL